jgi:hypothetical protein
MPFVHVFRNKADNMVIVMETYTDESLGDFYLFPKNSIPPDLDSFGDLNLNKNEAHSPSGKNRIEIKDTKKFLRRKIELAEPVDDKYFITKKGIKLGMPYQEVIKIYGKPDKEEIVGPNKTRIACSWMLYGIWTEEYEETPLAGSQLEEAIKAKKDVIEFYRATIDFVKGKVERIHLSYYNPG